MTSCALLGGSFDPIHNGHLHIAREILKSGYVSRLVFLPNARHNFKKSNVVLDFQHRLALVRDALEPGMEAWEDDADGSGYTAELLQKLYRKHPQLLFHFVIGSDNLANLPLWYDFAWLRANARFLIIPPSRLSVTAECAAQDQAQKRSRSSPVPSLLPRFAHVSRRKNQSPAWCPKAWNRESSSFTVLCWQSSTNAITASQG